MEEEFYKDEFEQFLQQQANNHRMYPTDGVWQGIYKKLHGDKKWPALTIAAFAFLTAIIAISVYFSPKPNIFALTPATIAAPGEPTNSPSKTFSNPLTISASNNRNSDTQRDFVTADRQNSATRVDDVLPTTMTPVEVPGSLAETVQLNQQVSVAVATDRKISALSISTDAGSRALTINPANSSLQELQKDLPSAALTGSQESVIDQQETQEVKAASTVPTPNTTTPKQDPDDKNMADKFLKEHITDINLYTTTKKQSQKKRFSYTIYIAPSISYRKLKEEDITSRKNDNLNGPVALNYVTDVNKVVRHTPGTGIETGIGFTYHLSNKLGIRTGFQFNIRQYNIEAYKAPGEIATIALLSRTNGVDAINSYAVYRNNNGYFSTELVNRHYQFSIPVGMEWEVIGNKKVKLNVAATLQPTYTITRNNYLLTTNYKNYTESSAMLRKWNVNSNLEAYMSVKMGDYKWQVGPQLRYQHLPTFITEYPIREHLMDYGFKIGVSKVIK